ncbi:MAG: sulfotransferase domain-containing protein [Desulfobacterales bacterium]
MIPILTKYYKRHSGDDKKKTLKIFPDDIFLVSYPKSGNTWVRFLIANLLKNDDELIDFHSAIKFVPEIGTHTDVIANLDRPRIIKSHELYNDKYPKVVYIVRDPRDVYVSYYHYLKKKLLEGMTFAQFLRKDDLYPSRWHEHVKSWIDKPNLQLVKYEDLLVDTYGELSKILSFIDRDDFDEKQIKKAIAASTFEQMKKIESEKGRPFKTKADAMRATQFLRKGIKGDWINYFNEDDLKLIEKEAKNFIVRLGYRI